LALNNLAGLMSAQGRLAEAEHLYRRALAAIEAGGGDATGAAQVRANLALISSRQARDAGSRSSP
jgi:Flp pilus assembly protein TadD